MMGTKARLFTPIAVVSLEELVPQEHFYRHLDQVLDLSFVRDLVKATYAHGGRPSIDPVVFFKLQLVMFFEDIRSERLLMQLVADKLSVRWYVGYNLDEPLPDHSSLTRIRERYGVEVFRRFFEAIVEQCQQAGLVWGKELYFDGTKVLANASTASVKPRFAVEAHLAHLFTPEAEEVATPEGQVQTQEEPAKSETIPQEGAAAPRPLPISLEQEAYEELKHQNEARHHWIEEHGAQDRRVTSKWYHRVADLRVSTTDPDASLMLTKDGAHLGYHTHYVVDGGKARIILHALVTPSEVMDNQPMLDLRLSRAHTTGNCGRVRSPGTPSMARRKTSWRLSSKASVPTCPCPIWSSAAPTLANATSAMFPSKTCLSAPTTRSCTCILLRQPNMLSAIKQRRPPVMPVPSKPNAPPAPAVGISAATSPKSTSSACAAIRPRKLTKRRCASAVSGWNPYLQKAKTGTACVGFAYANSGGSTVRR